MSKTDNRVLIVNNNGIGNGIITLPFLSKLNRLTPGFQFWHTENPIFENGAFLQYVQRLGYMGSIPPLWRRFSKESQPFIIQFIRANDIGRVINLRLQETELDGDYLAFKKQFNSEVDFWDLDELGDVIFTQPVHDSIRKLFEKKTGQIFNGGFDWLSSLRKGQVKENRSGRVGLYLGASQPKKRWSLFGWYEVAVHILERETYDLHLLPGLSYHEQILAYEVYKMIDGSKRRRVNVTNGMHLWSFTKFLSECKYLITHDTFTSHLAAAIGVPQVVIFLATDNKIWKPNGGCHWELVQSQEPFKCTEFKNDGTCRMYYENCGRVCGADVTGSEVCEAWNRLTRRYFE